MFQSGTTLLCRVRLKCDGTRTETRFGLSAKRTSLFKSAGASVQSTTGSRGVRISGSNAGYTMFRDSVRVLATHSIRQFPLHFPSRASPCAITFQLDSAASVSRNNHIAVHDCSHQCRQYVSFIFSVTKFAWLFFIVLIKPLTKSRYG